jgi:hypothetical protein
MSLSFPSSPSVGATSVQNGRTYSWTGYAWELSVSNSTNVVTASTVAGFPATGSSGVLYVALDTARTYQWQGAYLEVGTAGGVPYTLPAATSSSLGGVVVGSGLAISSGTVSANVTSVAGRTGAVTLTSADVSGVVPSNTTGITGASAITNIVSLTQANYDALSSKSATTLYIING